MTTHVTALDINAILIARRAALDAAMAAAHAAAVKPGGPIRTQSLPTAPVPAAVATPAAVPVAPVVSDADLSAFIARSIPVLQSAVQTVIHDHGVAGVLNLIQVVSTLVRDGLPQAKGADARSIVIAVFIAAVQTFVTPMLPVFIRPFVPGLITAGVSALEVIYQAQVRRRGA